MIIQKKPIHLLPEGRRLLGKIVKVVIWVLLISLVVLNLLDFGLTFVGITYYGAQEGNIFFAEQFHNGIFIWGFLFKFGIVLIIFYASRILLKNSLWYVPLIAILLVGNKILFDAVVEWVLVIINAL